MIKTAAIKLNKRLLYKSATPMKPGFALLPGHKNKFYKFKLNIIFE